VRAHRHVVPPLAGRSRLVLDEDGLKEWGRELGRASTAPLVITLTGELGAGKTTLATAICEGYGVEEEVTSPTYALVHRYAAPKSPIYHVDLYRLDNPSQLTNIGWSDIISDHALVIVEWPERAGSRIPSDHVPIDIDYVAGESDRRLLLAG
jgi:tRNA threonylcarbamoyladenosine biosynthesis protein TsaE